MPASIFPGSSWVVGANPGASIAVVNGEYRASYPRCTGSVYTWLNFNVPPNTMEFYVRFRARMPGHHQPTKFFKIFSANQQGRGYANTTFGLTSYTHAAEMAQISFGDGTYLENDVANVVNLGGDYPEWVGRAWGSTAVVNTPAGHSFAFDTAWHTFKIFMKFNDGTSASNEVPNGAYRLEIDNVVYADVRGLFNRHPLNLPIESLSWGNWCDLGTQPFDLYFDDIVISTGGWAP